MIKQKRRAVHQRPHDVLRTGQARVAELLHSDLDLSNRVGCLAVRLEYGVRAGAVEIARVAGRDLGRGDYRRLSAAGLTNAAAINVASDKLLLDQLDGDKDKLRVVKMFALHMQSREKEVAPVQPLQPYQA